MHHPILASSQADDCVVYRESTNESNVVLLQADLGAVSEWCNLWQMTFNTNKSKIMRVSRRNTQPSQYLIFKTQLTSVTSFMYRRVHITCNLSLKPYSDHIISNPNSMVEYLKRHFFLRPISPKCFCRRRLYVKS